jgi:CTP synthase (UTP-ammonia lyase)
MNSVIRIGVLGDFNPQNPTHVATNDGIQHAAEALDQAFETVWLPTDESHDYNSFHAFFCSPGSPYRSLEGALEGIRYARENNVPFIGTCGGCQHLILEYARNVMRFTDAAHAEYDPYASRLFLTPLSCLLAGKTMEVAVKAGSKAAQALRSTQSLERYYCNFGLNPEYREAVEKAGLAVTGTDHDGEVRIVELPSHPFFMGTLFVPQARSTKDNPHPIVAEFCRVAAAHGTRAASAAS